MGLKHGDPHPPDIGGGCVTVSGTCKVDVRLPGKGNSNSHGARPVHQIISMIKWIRTRKLSIKNSLFPVRSQEKDPTFGVWRSLEQSEWRIEGFRGEGFGKPPDSRDGTHSPAL